MVVPQHASEDAFPRVAVALASRNGAKYIRQQVLSILWQQGCSATVFVRDDGSNDGTLEELNRLAAEHPGRLIIVDDGEGPSRSAAQNFFLLLMALRTQSFDWLALADQDDIWEANKLDRAITIMSIEKTDGYSSNLVAFACDGAPPMLIRKDHPEKLFDHLFQTASAGCTYVLSAKLASLVGAKLAQNAPNPDIAHDILIYAIARSHGFRWSHDRHAHILYRQHAANVVGSRSGMAGAKARWRLIRSGWYRQQTATLAPYLAGSSTERKIVAAASRAGFLDRLWIARLAPQCRRRKGEVLMFALAQLIG